MSAYEITDPENAPPYFKLFATEISGHLKSLGEKIDKFESSADEQFKVIQRTLRAEIKSADNKAQQALDLALANEKNLKDLKDELFTTKRKCIGLREEVNRLSKENVDLNTYGRRENLVIRGIPEQEGEDQLQCVAAVRKSFKNKLQLKERVDHMVFQRCHRLGSIDAASKYTRPIIVRFLDYNDRQLVWSKRSKISDPSYSLSENFANKTEYNRRLLYPIMKKAKAGGEYEKVYLRGDTLFLDNKQFRVDVNLDELPEGLEPVQFSSKTNNDWIIFGGIHSVYNWMSNYYMDRIKYNRVYHDSVEHAYQHSKAVFHGDTTAANKILGAVSAPAAKQCGMEVRKFSKEKWDKAKGGIMLNILRCKFADGTKMAKLLKKTDGKSLAEAGKSKSFAIGLTLHNKNIFDTEKWAANGNILGRSLMEVRSEL